MNSWDVASFGCIERGSFRLNPAARTALTSTGTGPFHSATADRRAPITAHFQTWQSFAQQKAFWQWYHVDLRGGALPFKIDLWLWNRVRTVRARLVGQFTTGYQDQHDMRLTAGTFEIERESIYPGAHWVDPPPQKDATCLPPRASFMMKRGIQKTTCVPERSAFIVPPELQKAATCVPAKSDLLK